MIVSKGSVNAAVCIELLRRPIKRAERKIFLIAGRSPAHREEDRAVRCSHGRQIIAVVPAALFARPQS